MRSTPNYKLNRNENLTDKIPNNRKSREGAAFTKKTAEISKALRILSLLINLWSFTSLTSY